MEKHVNLMRVDKVTDPDQRPGQFLIEWVLGDEMGEMGHGIFVEAVARLVEMAAREFGITSHVLINRIDSLLSVREQLKNG